MHMRHVTAFQQDKKEEDLQHRAGQTAHEEDLRQPQAGMIKAEGCVKENLEGVRVQ